MDEQPEHPRDPQDGHTILRDAIQRIRAATEQLEQASQVLYAEPTAQSSSTSLRTKTVTSPDNSPTKNEINEALSPKGNLCLLPELASSNNPKEQGINPVVSLNEFEVTNSPTKAPNNTPTTPGNSPLKSLKRGSLGHFKLPSFGSLRRRGIITASPSESEVTDSPTKTAMTAESSPGKSPKKGSFRLRDLSPFNTPSFRRRGPIQASTSGTAGTEKAARPSILSPSTFVPPQSPLRRESPVDTSSTDFTMSPVGTPSLMGTPSPPPVPSPLRSESPLPIIAEVPRPW
ncbi:hypothetical protein N7457_003809 [Penicillium paradoxum]|uniref:uncharacterized protein n=1 Tax=Penicillium paradoxum TaxID=176176 RepID=UPI0025477975|nr:uncharacterized protein N7457_003809 [Penicillium paradoxum]KAJ5782035.1 hypothetical protein N7457_003809 [Penicillium paradoxum]